MQRDWAPCLGCATPVPRDARTCPVCDYDVGRDDRRRLWLGGIGTALTLSIVLAPVGFPLLWLAHRHRLAAEGTVTHRAEAPLGEQLASVLRGFLALDRCRKPAAEFPRASGHPGPESGRAVVDPSQSDYR